MVALRRPHAVTIARTGTVNGERVQPPGGGQCNKCGGSVSAYNPHGRCWACIHRYGCPPRHPEPIEPGSRRGPKKLGHLPDCECLARRRPALDADGNQKIRGERTRVWLIDVTCPICMEGRAVRTDSNRAHLCVTNYLVHCYKCSSTAEARAASRARTAA